MKGVIYMATSAKVLNDKLREQFLNIISEMFSDKGEEVLRTGSNEIALPCVDEESNEKFVVLTVKVPTGSRDGDPYDGYSMAEEYEIKSRQKAESAAKKAAEKAKKMEKDAKQRAKQAELKARRTGE